jgi:putative membrane protein
MCHQTMMNSSLPPEDPNTRLAGERTLLAWVRTGLAMMGFGFVVARFGLFLSELAAVGNLAHAPRTGFSLWIGIGLVLMGVVVNVLAALEHRRFLRRIVQRQPYIAPGWSLGIVVAVALSILGVGMAAYLVFLRT